jgi:hypothetical protein
LAELGVGSLRGHATPSWWQGTAQAPAAQGDANGGIRSADCGARGPGSNCGAAGGEGGEGCYGVFRECHELEGCLAVMLSSSFMAPAVRLSTLDLLSPSLVSLAGLSNGIDSGSVRSSACTSRQSTRALSGAGTWGTVVPRSQLFFKQRSQLTPADSAGLSRSTSQLVSAHGGLRKLHCSLDSVKDGSPTRERVTQCMCWSHIVLCFPPRSPEGSCKHQGWCNGSYWSIGSYGLVGPASLSWTSS